MLGPGRQGADATGEAFRQRAARQGCLPGGSGAGTSTRSFNARRPVAGLRARCGRQRARHRCHRPRNQARCPWCRVEVRAIQHTTTGIATQQNEIEPIQHDLFNDSVKWGYSDDRSEPGSQHGAQPAPVAPARRPTSARRSSTAPNQRPSLQHGAQPAPVAPARRPTSAHVAPRRPRIPGSPPRYRAFTPDGPEACSLSPAALPPPQTPLAEEEVLHQQEEQHRRQREHHRSRHQQWPVCGIELLQLA